ncbi:uncharacterized protein LOC113656168 [Tachysurus fulvidraco]|uniref:uncharacterized protein LOC113656168 n=1 Tax=Tachysurus fulvidraco TaxID=1234273 RepID=UPI001FEE14EB|nr:uncharacterized protein LOC113656168 [Tachysurus fulvidraco]
MEEQVVERKEGLDCTEVPDKVFLGDVETYKVLQRGVDEGKVLEGTLDFGEDQTKVLENSVYMGKAQILKGVGVDQFQHEMSSNIMGMVQNEVLDGNMDVVKVYTVVLEGGSDKDDAIHGNILEDSMDMEVQYKVLDGGIDVNKVEDKFFMSGVEVDKYLEGGLDMDKVQCRVLECRMNADKLQDKFLKGGVEIGKFQDKVLKGDVHHLVEDNFLKKNVNVDKIYGTVNMEKVIDDVLEDAVAMDMVQNRMEDGVDVDNTLDEVLKCSVNININENGVDLKEAHDMVHEDRVDVKGNLNAQERFDTLRCQVRIITRHNLRLHMANHTTRDVYVRLLGHGERITGSGKEAYDDHEEDNLLLV